MNKKLAFGQNFQSVSQWYRKVFYTFLYHKKAQVSIIGLWLLVILGLFAVGLGQRVSLALKINEYERDSLKALYLAKAGINRAIAEIKNDLNTDYDAVDESWTNNPGIFEKISLSGNADEFAIVSYTITKEEAKEEKFGCRDEESKININTASPEIIKGLFAQIEPDNAERLAKDTLIWLGKEDNLETESYYKDTLGYPCKKALLNNIEEIILIKGIKELGAEKLKKIKDLATVYGAEKININTASSDVLKIIALKGAADAGVSEIKAQELTEAIITFRDNNGKFTSAEITKPAICAKLSIAPAGDTAEILEKITAGFSALSANFRIEATGYVRKASRKIEAVYDHKDNKIIYWHES